MVCVCDGVRDTSPRQSFRTLIAVVLLFLSFPAFADYIVSLIPDQQFPTRAQAEAAMRAVSAQASHLVLDHFDDSTQTYYYDVPPVAPVRAQKTIYGPPFYIYDANFYTPPGNTIDEVIANWWARYQVRWAYAFPGCSYVPLIVDGSTTNWWGSVTLQGTCYGGTGIYGSVVTPYGSLSCPKDYSLSGNQCVIPLTATITSQDPKAGGCSDTNRANPCNAATGNKFQVETDFRSPDGHLSFTRYYNSLFTRDLGLGAGWNSSFQARLEIAVTSLIAWRTDGYGEPFTKTSTGQWQGDPDTKLVLTQDESGFTLAHPSGDVQRYDANGHLLSDTNSNGETTTYTYDSTGDLVSVTGPFGHTLTFTYTGAHLATMTDPDGNVTRYGYDSNNNLTTVTYPDGSVKQYLYEDTAFPHALTGITDEDGNRFATFSYDSNGKAIVSEHAQTDNGSPQERTLFSYDSATQTTVTDAVGNREVIRFTTQLNAPVYLGSTYADGSTVSQTTDTHNNVTSHTDQDGHVTTYTYNDTNQETSKTEAAGTADARTTYYQYLSPTVSLPTRIQTPSVLAGSEKETDITYQGMLPTQITQTGYTPSGNTVTRTVTLSYNAQGQVTQVDGPRSDVHDVTTFQYYACTNGGACGQLQSVTNALGQTTTYDSYDADGRLLAMTDPNGLKTTYVYDARGRLTQLTQTPPLGSPRVTQYTYDGVGQLTQSVGPDGLTLNYTYDAAHDLRTITDNVGDTISYSYDLKGNRTQTVTSNPDGTVARSLTEAYDLYNHVTQINNGGSITQQVYDALGNLITETDPNNDPATTDHYDALNRLIQTIDRMGNTTAYGFDVNDHPTEVQAPNGATTTYAYDDLGDLLQEQSPDRGTLTYTHDAAGNVLTQTDARGVIATYTYDALNRPLTVTYTSPPGGNLLVGWFRDLLERWHHLWGHKPDLRDPSTAVFSDDVTYTYDTCANGLGRLCGIQDQSGVTLKAYDTFGNLLQETRNTLGRTYITQYTYDAGNRIQTETYPSGRTVTYTRDPVGRVTAIHTAINGTDTAVLSNITYRADGLPVNETFGNGIQDSRSYDTQGRLLTQYLGVDTRVYSYDANGNETSLQTLPQVYRYAYDPLDRLVQDIIGNHSTDLTYDPNGNRLTQATSTITIPYAYTPNSNRLIQVGNDTLILDAAGNTISDHNGQRTFTYSPANRLFQVYTGRHLTAVYLYNAQSQRTAKVTDQGITLYHYDTNGNLLTETTDQGKTIRDYVYLSSVPVAQIDEHGNEPEESRHEDGRDEGHHDRIFYLHTDALGTPRVATDQNQKLVWRWEGSAFGDSQPETGEALREATERPDHDLAHKRADEENHTGEWNTDRADAGGVTINLRFPGQYYDRETDLLYNWNRYYNPIAGRYISSDPFGLTGGVATYVYVGDAPTRWIDPLGLAADFEPRLPRQIPQRYTPPDLSRNEDLEQFLDDLSNVLDPPSNSDASFYPPDRVEIICEEFLCRNPAGTCPQYVTVKGPIVTTPGSDVCRCIKQKIRTVPIDWFGRERH